MPNEALTKKDLEFINYQFKELANKIDTNDVRLNGKIDDLRNNYTTRLDTLDAFQKNADKVFAAKTEQDKINESDNKRLTSLENWQNKIIGGLILFNVILGIAVVYLTNKH